MKCCKICIKKPVPVTGMILMGLLYCSISFSQSFLVTSYSTRDGLPSPYILNTFQDNYGYLWISTINGISRFDGKHFTNYNFNEGLPNPRGGVLFMDTRHRLWMSTLNGVGEFRKDRLHTFPLSDSIKSFYVHNFMETSDGAIWVATSAGVYQFKENYWEKIHLYPGYENRSCRALQSMPDGIYMNYGDLIVLKDLKGEYKVIASAAGSEHYYLNFVRSGDDLFCPTINGIFTLHHGSMERLPGVAGRIKGLYTFLCDSKKRKWIANTNGLQLVAHDDDNKLITIYKKPLINLVSSINEDAQGNIWAADFEGLVRITQPGFTVFKQDEIKSNGMIRNIIRLPGEPLLINEGRKGFVTYNINVFAYKTITPENKSTRLNELIIDNYCTDDEGSAWFCLRGFELARLKKGSLQFLSSAYRQLGEDAFDILYDTKRKKVMAAILGQSFPCPFDGRSFNPMPIKNNMTIPGITIKLHQSINGVLLFATDKGNLFSIDTNGQCREQLIANRTGHHYSFFMNDVNGDTWIAQTGKGLLHCGWNNDSLTIKETFNTSNGLLNDYFCGLSSDQKNNIWVATLGGITVLSATKAGLDNSSYSIRHSFTLANLNLEISEASRLHNDNSGNIWLSLPDKLVCFYPDTILGKKPISPTIHIEDVRLDLKKTDWATYTHTTDSLFGIPNEINLPYNKNSIGIYFKGISTSGTDGIEYSYLLEGLTEEWSVPSTTDFVSFVKLPPGKFTFFVKAKLPGGEWNEPARFIFSIKKPFWTTWWFRLVAALLAAVIIISVFRHRINQVRTKTNVRNQLMEMEMTALKAQMNPHFIYNALNSIQSLIASNKTKEAGKYISQFAKLLRQVLDQADNNVISLEKELQTVQLYISLESLRLSIEPELRVQIDPAIDPLSEKIPPLILQPFVENALWHGLSQSEKEKTLTINIKESGDWIICTIEDNGIGRAQAAQFKLHSPPEHVSRGINITTKRLSDFNAGHSKQPVIYVDLFDEYGLAAGTRVILHISRKT